MKRKINKHSLVANVLLSQYKLRIDYGIFLLPPRCLYKIIYK